MNSSKKILGLDLGTNSIGWALIEEQEEQKKILGIGSRIIPMSQDILGKFESGNSVSQTAERTAFRGIRRIRERYLLRRERLHRVLNLLGFLPEHYAQAIDFENRPGKFKPEKEPKLAWKECDDKQFDYIFRSSFNEMVDEFKVTHSELFEAKNSGEERKIPYDWTIYYLRKKALKAKIEKEELAWLLLNFNQKRGYYQLRGEEEEENPNKLVEFHALKVDNVTADEAQKGKNEIWYNVILENGWIYRRSSKNPLFDWIGKTKEFIVTTDLNDDGSVKNDKEGNEKRSFRAPSEEDWTLQKKKTENDITQSNKTVGSYIYDTLLQNPKQKINGKLVRTIERKFYKHELFSILENQKHYHPELQNDELYNACINELYRNNEAHRNTIQRPDFIKLFIDDIIFYQRPLKSKKSLISNCPYEYRVFKNENGERIKSPIKCIAKSHPLFQEFRLWQFIHNLKIYARESELDGKFQTDVDVTKEFLKSEEDVVNLFEWLNDRKEIKQDTLLSSYFKIKKTKGSANLPYRWNYVEDKEYPCYETHSQIKNRLSKLSQIPEHFLTPDIELMLWHILYSVEDKAEIEKALKTFADKHNLENDFVDIFKKFPPFKKEYASYSAKAIKKILPLMRMGKYWNEDEIQNNTRLRIESIIERLQSIGYNEEQIDSISDDDIPKQILKSFIKCNNAYAGLNTYQACYAVYGRHSEASDLIKWETPADINWFLDPKNPEGFKQHSLRNPIVEQIITETLRVVRDIWTKHGDFSEIHVELGRKMKKTKQEREYLTKQITDNENTNLRIKALLIELKNDHEIENVRPYSPSQQEILKIYEEGALNAPNDIPDDIVRIAKSAQPSKSELIRYKCWLEQGYRSPYTGEIIPLTKLFTSAYEIEHVIPQSRYFDDSLSNKVICEAEVNKEKDNALGYEFIKNNEGRIIELSFGKKVKVLTLSEYEEFVKRQYGKNRSKMKKLLMDEIPDAFIERQLNDSRYISKVVKSLLSNIVREDGEQEATSKNVISCSGGVTNTLKQDWGLNDIWNNLVYNRFERMNEKTKSNDFGQWTNKGGKKVFQTEMPLSLQKGFNKKRIDHRHHAMDALIIACATRNHINYLNNEHARKKDNKIRFDLRNKLRRLEDIVVERYENGQKIRKNIKVAKEFIKPWETFTQDAQAALENIVVSFKQNNRVINKSSNYYESYKNENGDLRLNKNGKPEKDRIKQTKGDNWAIRKPMHKDTVAGQVNLQFKKTIPLSSAIDQWKNLADKKLKTKISQLINEGLEKKQIIKFFAEREYQWMGKEISKPELYYFSNEKEILVASRVNLNDSFNSKKIESITDTGIQKILFKHLANYNEVMENQTIEHPELAFSPEGIDDMNRNITALNNGKSHQPITKVRTYEPKGNKFNVGNTGNKKGKYVEAAKGTNLFFAIYVDESGNRSYETIPLNIIIERLKQGQKEVPEMNGNGDQLLEFLSPNDLVYVPTEDELYLIQKNEFDIKPERIYKMVSSSGTQCFFIPNIIANPIVQTIELGANNKSERTWNGQMIKQVCVKLKVDRLGNVYF